MRVGLIDVDGGNRFPNIALMKISAWHKAQGDVVSWYNSFDGWYDLVYMSKVFSFTPDYDYVINATEIRKGGSGYCIEMVNGKEVFHPERDVQLPYEIEHIYPDYSIYPTLTEDTAFVFLTRCCLRLRSRNSTLLGTNTRTKTRFCQSSSCSLNTSIG